MENIEAAAGHLRDTPPWREQIHFSEPQLTLAPHYTGPATRWSRSEALAVFSELFHYFGLGGGDSLPRPPSGLPGALRLEIDDDVMASLSIGANYLIAAARREPRRMVNLYADAVQERQRLIREGREALAEDQIDRERKRDEDRQARKKPNSRRRVYFIASETGPIKIGVADRPNDRLRSLQFTSPLKLSILATVKGGQPVERAYHKRFAAHRLHGEWFERAPEILAEIDRLNPRQRRMA